MAEGTETNPVIQNLSEQDVSSAVAVAGHPLHAMAVHFPIALVFGTLGCDLFYWWSADPFWLRAGLWACGVAFVSGVLAAAIGTAELLLVPGIRGRAASWMHAIVAMALIAMIGMNWGLRLVDLAAVLPLGLLMSLLCAAFTGVAGYHGGKLILDHGIALMVSSRD
ncbi:DUF2231 domain-containing protein [Roseomonas gilardii]|uniref:DUF2231 domain-containing protein n=1 Tax=Roseomonas gilardii TaxID=257708 RepID=UPI00119F034F|nr:DUF2231 domain-containing protein [Roseomonas gilardii]